MPKTINERAREIVEAEGIGFVAARIRAAKEAFGIPDATRPMNKAEVRDLAMDGSVLPFAVLAEISADDRASHETRAMAADKYLANMARIEGEAEGDTKLQIVVKGGLPD